MGLKNFVVAGDYLDRQIVLSGKKLYILDGKFGFGKKIFINKDTVSEYEVINAETTKSAKSAVVRGAVGGAVLGPLGMLAGGVSAKNKGSAMVAVQFKDGKRSLLELDKKNHEALVKLLF